MSTHYRVKRICSNLLHCAVIGNIRSLTYISAIQQKHVI